MIYYVLVENGVVVRRSVANGPIVKVNPPGAEWIQNDTAQIGWTYANGVFTPPVQPPPPPPDSETVRRNSFASRAEVADLADKLRNATPEQIDNWLENNLTNLTQARVVIGTILKLLAVRI